MAKDIDSGVEKSTKELGEESLKYMKKQYTESDNNLGGHIGNINLKSYRYRYKKGFVLSSGDDEVAVYNEFGTGIVGKGTNSLAKKAGYNYNVPSPHKGEIPAGAIKEYGRKFCEEVTTKDTWWYHKNNKWWYTKGMRGKNMYSSLVEELNKNVKNRFNATISQIIGNYNGGK